MIISFWGQLQKNRPYCLFEAEFSSAACFTLPAHAINKTFSLDLRSLALIRNKLCKQFYHFYLSIWWSWQKFVLAKWYCVSSNLQWNAILYRDFFSEFRLQYKEHQWWSNQPFWVIFFVKSLNLNGTEHFALLLGWIFFWLSRAQFILVHGQIFDLCFGVDERWQVTFHHFLHRNQGSNLRVCIWRSWQWVDFLNLGFKISHWGRIMFKEGSHFWERWFCSRKERTQFCEVLSWTIFPFEISFYGTKKALTNWYFLLWNFNWIDSESKGSSGVHNLKDFEGFIFVAQLN